MATLALEQVNKVYENGFEAIVDLCPDLLRWWAHDTLGMGC